MHSLEAELRQLHAAGAPGKDTATQTIAHAIDVDSGAIFSLYQELRAALYIAVLLIVAGIGMLLNDNYEHLGPNVIIIVIALLAAACYAFAIRTQRLGRPRLLVGDYILLLGALLVSADVAFAETQFHLLGERWSWYLLLLAGWHAATAYALDSRLVLSVALAALAGWFGVEHNLNSLFNIDSSSSAGTRALTCAVLVLGWRIANERLSTRSAFNEVLEHYAANLGFWGGLIWCGSSWLLPGVVVVAILAVIVISKGLRIRSELLVAYGVVYSAIGICIVVGKLLGGALLTSFVTLLAVIGVATLLWRLHKQMRSQP